MAWNGRGWPGEWSVMTGDDRSGWGWPGEWSVMTGDNGGDREWPTDFMRGI